MNSVTVFSLVPQEVKMITSAFKPGEYLVDPSDGWVPTRLVIGPGHFFVETGSGATYTIPVDPKKIAEGMIKDWLNGSYFDRKHQPGLWMMAGEVEASAVPQSLYDERFKENMEWMREVVKHADEEYLRRNKSPGSVTRLARSCASALQLERPWGNEAGVKVPNLAELVAAKERSDGSGNSDGQRRSRQRKSAA